MWWAASMLLPAALLAAMLALDLLERKLLSDP